MKSLLLFALISFVISDSEGSQDTCNSAFVVPQVNLQATCRGYAAYSRRSLMEERTRLEAELQELIIEEKSAENCQPNQNITFRFSLKDCQDAADIGAQSGTYQLMPVNKTLQVVTGRSADGIVRHYWLASSHTGMRVYCNIDNSVGWTILMRRGSGQIGFDRTLQEYKDGFGDIEVDVNFSDSSFPSVTEGDFWLGLDNIHILLSNPLATYSLMIVITDTSDVQYSFPYESFYIGDESTSYRLRLGEYIGQIADPFGASNHTEFRCSSTRLSTIMRRRRTSCDDNGHSGTGCWWFYVTERRLCGYNNLHAEDPFWGIFYNEIKSVVMMIKRN